jgi:nucleoside-diphosphate-sugar epimerase
VEDLCRATELAVSAPREAVHSQTFNTGADRDNFSILAVAEAVREEYPECEIRLGSLGADRRSYAVAFGKIREMLGFEPVRTLEGGVAELRALFERVGLTRERFEDPSFTRLKRIRILLETGKVNRRLFWAGAS